MAAKSTRDAHLHHALTDPPLAAAALYAASATASEFIHHPGYVVAAATVAAVVGGFAGVISRRHMWRLIHLALCAAFAVAWLAYTQYHSPFTAASAASLVIGLAALWPLYPIAWNAERKERDRAVKNAEALVERKARNGDWPGMLAALGCHGVTVEQRAEQRAGYTLTLRRPINITHRRLVGLIEQIENALDLNPGTVRMEQGEGARTLAHVTTRDVMSEIVTLPDEHEPVSVNDPFPVGIAETGEPMTVLLREVVALISGIRGSGKSNLINVLLAQLTRCTDVVIWAVDLKGGRTMRPWLRPWLDGETDRPVIDWVATTREEAGLMLRALITVIDTRSHTGQGEKIIPSPQQPAIIFVCDEVATLFGMRSPGGVQFADLGMDIVGRGRSEAVDAILAVLRSTVTMVGSGDLKSQCLLRFALGVANEQDARLAIDDSQLARGVAGLRAKGSMYVQDDVARPVPTKTYRIEYGDIAELARQRSWFRPGLEPELEDALGEVYAQRWSLERAGHLVKGSMPPAQAPAAASRASAVQGARPAAVATGSLPAIPKPPADAEPAWRTAKGDPIPRAFDPSEFEAAFEAIAKDLEGLGAPATATAPHPGRLRMLGLLQDAGEDGMGPSALLDALNAEGLKCVRQTVQEWLKDEVKAGTVVRRGVGDYVHKDHA